MSFPHAVLYDIRHLDATLNEKGRPAIRRRPALFQRLGDALHRYLCFTGKYSVSRANKRGKVFFWFPTKVSVFAPLLSLMRLEDSGYFSLAVRLAIEITDANIEDRVVAVTPETAATDVAPLVVFLSRSSSTSSVLMNVAIGAAGAVGCSVAVASSFSFVGILVYIFGSGRTLDLKVARCMTMIASPQRSS